LQLDDDKKNQCKRRARLTPAHNENYFESVNNTIGIKEADKEICQMAEPALILYTIPDYDSERERDGSLNYRTTFPGNGCTNEIISQSSTIRINFVIIPVPSIFRSLSLFVVKKA
jgi:hypothetical protein